MTFEEILRRKDLEVAGNGYKNDGLKLDPGVRHLADVIYRMYSSNNKYAVEEFMENIRRAATRSPYTISFVSGLDNLFKECEKYNLITRMGYSITYKINVGYEGVNYFLQKGFATYAVMDAIKRKTFSPIEKMYYDVNLRDIHGKGTIHVDIMYKIGDRLYFVLVFMNKDLLNQDPNMIERVNRTLFGPVNRLRSNVSIVISPSVEVRGLIDIMRKYKDSNATAPIIVPFTDLRHIIPNSNSGNPGYGNPRFGRR